MALNQNSALNLTTNTKNFNLSLIYEPARRSPLNRIAVIATFRSPIGSGFAGLGILVSSGQKQMTQQIQNHRAGDNGES
ncbi:MAG TPA: hypothetical protein VMV89_03380 [Candidatus Paceibacterota bacterium]|nr:hypothetical protein [Candidatus Paceibacterota bacterium]